VGRNPREPSREAAKECSPQLALSLSKGRKSWVAEWKRKQAPEGAQENSARNLYRVPPPRTTKGTTRINQPVEEIIVLTAVTVT